MPSMGVWIRGPIIGHGSSATVSLASSPSSSELFAVKSVHLSHSALLHNEESILSTLTACPNIISCLGSDVTSHNGRLYCNLFLEYAPGGSLSDHIKRQPCGRLDESIIRSFTREILTGLSYLHLRGIAHCDIKSQNVLIGADGRAKIADLGCARRTDVDGGGCSQQIRGTPLFMAPEVVRGEEQGAAADVWAVGCTVIEMATGRSPWPEASDCMTAIQAIAFSEEVPGLPDDWDSEEGKDFLDRCLRRDPTERWTAEQLLKHPFVSVITTTTSPKSTLDHAGLWESLFLSDAEEEDDDDGGLVYPEQRIGKMASSCGGPNWDWDETWVSVRCNSTSGEEEYCSDAPQLEGDPQTNSRLQDTTIPSMTTTHGLLLSNVDIEHVSCICSIHLDGRFAINENESQLFSCKISEFYQYLCWYEKDDDSVNQKQSSLDRSFPDFF